MIFPQLKHPWSYMWSNFTLYRPYVIVITMSWITQFFLTMHPEQENFWVLVSKKLLTLVIRITRPSLRPSQVSGPGLWRSGSCDREVCISPQCIRLPPSGQAAEGRLHEWLPVHMEGWEDRRHVLSHPGLWWLGSRQWELPHTSEVGLGPASIFDHPLFLPSLK